MRSVRAAVVAAVALMAVSCATTDGPASTSTSTEQETPSSSPRPPTTGTGFTEGEVYVGLAYNSKMEEQSAAPGQLAGAQGVGFNPPLDVDAAQAPADREAAAECRRIMDEAGQPTSEALAWANMALLCDAFNFLANAADMGELSPDGVRLGANAMGSLPAASTFQIAFPDGRVDGAAAVRDMAFDGECNCLVYSSDEDHGM